MAGQNKFQKNKHVANHLLSLASNPKIAEIPAFHRTVAELDMIDFHDYVNKHYDEIQVDKILSHKLYLYNINISMLPINSPTGFAVLRQYLENIVRFARNSTKYDIFEFFAYKLECMSITDAQLEELFKDVDWSIVYQRQSIQMCFYFISVYDKKYHKYVIDPYLDALLESGASIEKNFNGILSVHRCLNNFQLAKDLMMYVCERHNYVFTYQSAIDWMFWAR
jgi:hypothetical protein